MQFNLRNDTSCSTYLPDVNSSSTNAELLEKQESITKAVIIAAGNGSRLHGYQNNCPKPLVKVGGMPLLQRVILSAKKAGVKEFVIVLGYQAARIRQTIKADKLGVKITWVRNLDWRNPNGISVLKAERYVEGKFFLFMSDHVFDPNILSKLVDIDLGNDQGLLCVDYALNRVPNLDDATKVRTENNRLINLGKSLTDFNAIDVGIFVCTPHLFDALRQSQANGDYTLSGGIRVLSQINRMRTFNIENSYWQDVDTIPDVRHAEKILLHSTRSKSDGIIAKSINRKISNHITKWLIRTPITPNQISIFNLLFTIFIAYLVSFGEVVTTIVAGILFQLVSILDGCDGEVAKIKLKNSNSGALVDTITDQMSYIAFIIGVTVGAYNASQNFIVFVAAVINIAFLIVALKYGMLYVRRKGSRSMRTFDKEISAFKNSKNKVWYLKLFGLVHGFGRRDLFSFIAALLMLSGNITFFYWLLMSVVFFISVCIFVSALTMLSQENKISVFNPIKSLLTSRNNGAALEGSIYVKKQKFTS
ncbi:MAG: NTP transferase domain-containing protein [bacterium]